MTKKYKGYFFDLDGTIYLGDQLLPGALELITKLREEKASIVFLSNNPTKDPAMYAEKLTRLGIPTAPSEILNTVVTMVDWLKLNAIGKTIFVIGADPLKSAIENAGFTLSETAEEIDIVIASYDSNFDYRKLQIAFDAIWFHKKARLVATNLDKYCPFPGGRGEPDTAAIVAAIEACTGVKCEVNVGKPDAFMAQTGMRQMGLAAADCIIVGDRLYTDIAMGKMAGMDSALVLTGETNLQMLAETEESDMPTYVLKSIEELLIRN